MFSKQPVSMCTWIYKCTCFYSTMFTIMQLLLEKCGSLWRNAHSSHSEALSVSSWATELIAICPFSRKIDCFLFFLIKDWLPFANWPQPLLPHTLIACIRRSVVVTWQVTPPNVVNALYSKHVNSTATTNKLFKECFKRSIQQMFCTYIYILKVGTPNLSRNNNILRSSLFSKYDFCVDKLKDAYK